MEGNAARTSEGGLGRQTQEFAFFLRLLAFRLRREVLTSFPSVGHHCFRVAVILSPYLGDFSAVVSLTAPHPQPRCGPARLPPSPPPSTTLESPPGLLSLVDRARRATARRRRRREER